MGNLKEAKVTQKTSSHTWEKSVKMCSFKHYNWAMDAVAYSGLNVSVSEKG